MAHSQSNTNTNVDDLDSVISYATTRIRNSAVSDCILSVLNGKSNIAAAAESKNMSRQAVHAAMKRMVQRIKSKFNTKIIDFYNEMGLHPYVLITPSMRLINMIYPDLIFKYNDIYIKKFKSIDSSGRREKSNVSREFTNHLKRIKTRLNHSSLAKIPKNLVDPIMSIVLNNKCYIHAKLIKSSDNNYIYHQRSYDLKVLKKMILASAGSASVKDMYKGYLKTRVQNANYMKHMMSESEWNMFYNLNRTVQVDISDRGIMSKTEAAIYLLFTSSGRISIPSTEICKYVESSGLQQVSARKAMSNSPILVREGKGEYCLIK